MNKKILLALSVALAVPSASHADTLYQSLPDLTIAPSVNSWCSSCSGSYRVYDTFSLGSASTINSVSFAVQSNYNFPTSINVGFFTLAGDLPDTEIASYTFAPADFVSTFATSFNTTIVTVALPGLALGAGTYDISFYSPVDLGVPGYAKDGGKLYQAGDGFHTDSVAAFSIDGTPGAVPEPASWAMMIGGFAIAGAAMRRRNTAVRFA